MMDRFGECVGKDIFALPWEKDLFLIFAPLNGMMLLVNPSYKKMFANALNGDADALQCLEMDSETLERLTDDLVSPRRTFDSADEIALHPSPLTLFLTNTCTMRCRYCYAGSAPPKKMPVKMAENIINIASEDARKRGLDYFSLNIHGRDVGACWHLFVHVIEFAKRVCSEKKLKLHTSIGTNGIYTTDQATYIAKNISSATLSVDGLPEVHDKYRILANGKPSFSKVLNTISVFDRLGYRYSIRMTILGDTLCYLPESVAFICHNTKALKIKVEPLYMRGSATEVGLTPPDPHDFVEKFIQAKAAASEKGVDISYSGARSGLVTCTFCAASQPILGVTPEGHLTSCYEILDPNDALSDYFIYGSFNQNEKRLIINKNVVHHLRNTISRRFESCWDCFCRWSCGGDCPAKYLPAERISNNTIPDRCIITRALTKHQLSASLSPRAVIDA